MASGTVHVKGHKEVMRAFRHMEADARKVAREALKKAADPVLRDARDLWAPVDARSAAGFRVAVRTRGVSVEQKLKRVTGQHPEFGARQMREALLPALMSNEDETVEAVEDAFDFLAMRNGF